MSNSFMKRKSKEKKQKEKKVKALRLQQEHNILKKNSLPYRIFIDGKMDPDEPFVRHSKEWIRKIPLTQESQLARRFMRDPGYYMLLREQDFYPLLCHLDEPDASNLKLFLDLFPSTIGTALFQINQDNLKPYLPFYDLAVIPMQDSWGFFLRKLYTKKSQYGTIYYGSEKSVITIDGISRQIGFTRHAIERLAERTTCGGVLDYNAAGDIFLRIYSVRYLELVRFENDNPAIAIYEPVLMKQHFYNYVCRGVLGPRYDERQTYYMKLAYLHPLNFIDNFVVAQTLYYPGYKDTPEHGMLMRHPMSFNERKYLLSKMRNSSYKEMATTGDFELVRFYQEHGCPQILTKAPVVNDCKAFDMNQFVEIKK